MTIAKQSVVLKDEETGDGVENRHEFPPSFDPSLIRIRSRVITVFSLLRRMENRELAIPHFQRRGGLWREDVQSRLIESMLVRIPLPAFYMDATNDDEWLVVDGLQRLTAISRFVLDKNLKLSGLEFLKEFENKTFDEIPRELQRRINETEVTVYLIEEGTPAAVKFNIFKRINTGGLPLSAQEIRHALYYGEEGRATRFLETLADDKSFQKAVGQYIHDERMNDREFVLRFLAFKMVGYNDYHKFENFDVFLSDAMSRLNRVSDDELMMLKQQFQRGIEGAQQIFGENAFRKILSNQKRRRPVNRALFDVFSVHLSKLNDKELQILIEKKKHLKEDMIRLLNEEEFDKAITEGTSTASRVKYRFEKTRQMLQGALL
ncbi:MAG: DUF262 domain-containing protein [Gammaproteobacteria bacterium]|nr:DUF262 domain-containing protein [Gammaproteobacteria bacterium]